MFFASDNTGPTHPKVMEAVAAANTGYEMPYGSDSYMDALRARIRTVFEAPNAEVFLVATGTAANALALATLCQPWQTIFCTPEAHIHEDECNAPEFFTSGAKLTLVPSENAKMLPKALRSSIQAEETRGVHGPQRGPISISNVTERGTVYSVEELTALCDMAKTFDVPTHLDGARFANAMVTLGCSPAEMTWRAGFDAVSFGGTKNGCMGAEAVIFFDPKHAWEFELRRKRGAHLQSKQRYMAAQMLAYLEDDLWLDLARNANAMNARLVRALKQTETVNFLFEPDANISFATFQRAAHHRLHNAGATYYLLHDTLDGGAPEDQLPARLVSDWSMSKENVDRFVSLVKG